MYAFANPFSSASNRPHAGIYTQVSVETGVTAADPHKLITMLFDGFMESVAQARGALVSGNIELKGRAIGRAVRIIEEGLRGGLNMNDGGPLAADLGELYTYISKRLTHANLRNDDAALVECSNLVEPLRSAWKQIAR